MSTSLLLVVVTPTGPLYIAINTSRTINCSVPDRGVFIFWDVIFKNGTVLTEGNLPGIKTTTTPSLTINTTDTSIVGLECRGLLIHNTSIQNNTRINLTVYGMLVKFKPK